MGTYSEGGEERPRSVQAFARRPRGEMSPTVRVARCWAEPPEVPQVSEPLLVETNSPAGRRQVSPLILGVGPPGLPKAREQEKPFPRGLTMPRGRPGTSGPDPRPGHWGRRRTAGALPPQLAGPGHSDASPTSWQRLKVPGAGGAQELGVSPPQPP